MAVTSSARSAQAATHPPRRRWPRRLAVLVLLAVVVVPLLAIGQVLLVSQRDDRAPTDVIVVLGAAQYQSTPSPVFESRLTHAKELYETGVAPRIVTVGGRQPGDITTEGAAGRDWLVANGVPAGDVTALATGSDTIGSMQAVTSLMRSAGWSSATVVTDPPHLARSIAIARALGVEARPSPTQRGAGSNVAPEYVLREAVALIVFWLRDRWSLG